MDSGREVEALEVSVISVVVLFDLHNYKASYIKILIAFGLDIVLLGAFVAYLQPIPEAAIIGIPIMLALFVLNLCTAVVSRFIWKKLYLTFALNSILSPIVFYFILIGWYNYRDHVRFSKWRFYSEGKYYELILNKVDTTYNFYKMNTNGSAAEYDYNEYMSGIYITKNGSIYLTDKLSPMSIKNDTLIGFAKNKIVLKEE